MPISGFGADFFDAVLGTARDALTTFTRQLPAFDQLDVTFNTALPAFDAPPAPQHLPGDGFGTNPLAGFQSLPGDAFGGGFGGPFGGGVGGGFLPSGGNPLLEPGGGSTLAQVLQQQINAGRTAPSGQPPGQRPAQPAPAPTSPTRANVPVGGPYVEYARSVAAAYGLDPDLFVRQIAQESGFDPNAYNPKSGATGIAQIVPQYHPGVDPADPYAALDYAARQMARLTQKYGDPRKALAAYNAGEGAVDQYGDVPPFEETQVYVNAILGGAAPAVPSAPPQMAPQTAPQTAPQGVVPPQELPGASVGPTAWEQVYGRGQLTPNQYTASKEEGLDDATAWAVCGPAAAIAFARATGKNPTMRQALDLARQVGWTRESGMAGTASQSQLLTRLGIANRVAWGAPDWGQIAQEVMAGRPVIIDAGDHYMVVENYDPRTGAFDFGNSARVLRRSGGQSWFRPEELPSLSSADLTISPTAAIYLGG